jgi:hypothetical protein
VWGPAPFAPERTRASSGLWQRAVDRLVQVDDVSAWTPWQRGGEGPAATEIEVWDALSGWRRNAGIRKSEKGTVLLFLWPLPFPAPCNLPLTPKPILVPDFLSFVFHIPFL